MISNGLGSLVKSHKICLNEFLCMLLANKFGLRFSNEELGIRF
ncbi:hypothetical protein Patl1_24372 [Pistacia atlantica]|uniref:Uncharacterized protein n=1 Tax=Pistacia atlantica TaxID=434234 RepID=A0ACC0ZY61_9ROSI|nr:hypothetical protein Patl1_24372 [Pistacia atlantica]